MASNIGIIYKRKAAPELKMVKLAAKQLSVLKQVSSIIILCLFLSTGWAQSLLKDSVMNAAMLGINYTMQLPMGELAQRYGLSYAIGGGVSFKVKHNVIIGIEGAYAFGRNVKNTDLFENITVDGILAIGRDGGLEQISIGQRGFQFKFNVGKIFPFKKPNRNSGILAMVGIGAIQHRIKINVNGGNVVYLDEEYRKGYDRLTAGVLVAPFLGYQYMSLNRRINLYAGVECAIGFTKGLRTWNFDTNTSGEGSSTDILIGFKAGWILPIYFRPTEKYFYY